MMHKRRPGRRVAIRGPSLNELPFAACVALMACAGGLTLLTYVCAFGGFLFPFTA